MKILSGGPELLDRIAPLWEELNKYHMEKSIYFSEDIKLRQFETRKNAIVSKAIHLRADIVMDLKEKRDIGYCVSTINDSNMGEIDSIFIREQYRRNGIGRKLIETALAWLDDHGVVGKLLSVGSGNDEVINFYKIFGFYPAAVYLVQKC